MPVGDCQNNDLRWVDAVNDAEWELMKNESSTNCEVAWPAFGCLLDLRNCSLDFLFKIDCRG